MDAEREQITNNIIAMKTQSAEIPMTDIFSHLNANFSM